MKWFLIDKSGTPQPDGTKYNDARWKEALAREGRHQCVYCAIHENHMGGIRAFHVEHYRPKSRYPALTHDFSNLFYVCPVCNNFKGDDWPDEPCSQHSHSAYPDPSKVNYQDLFLVKNHSVEGQNVAGRYLVDRLYLNRPHLILLRRWLHLRQRLENLEAETHQIIARLQHAKHMDVASVLIRLHQEEYNVQNLQRKIEEARTYATADVTRP